MKEFLERNNLTVVNGLSLCKGVITRSCKCNGKYEKSALDFFVVCKRILGYLTCITCITCIACIGGR